MISSFIRGSRDEGVDTPLDYPDLRSRKTLPGHGLRRAFWIIRESGLNGTPHETLGGDTPGERWEAGRPLRFPDDSADLYRRFVVRQSRKVSADHVIKWGGRLWEAPRGLARNWVEVARHVLDGRIWVLHEGRMVELTELDPHANATDPRRSAAEHQPLHSEGVPTTAATTAFNHDLRPLTGPDGGFSDEEGGPEAKQNKENDS